MKLSDYDFDQLSKMGRTAWRYGQWQTLDAITIQMRSLKKESAEIEFLSGLAKKHLTNQIEAIPYFEKGLQIESARYDCAIELAAAYHGAREPEKAYRLIQAHQEQLTNSPIYLNMAATTLVDLGFADSAYPLYQRAVELQPDVPLFQANLAACCIFVGEAEQSKQIYTDLVTAQPDHQRHYYQLSRLTKAVDNSMIEQLVKIISKTENSPQRNIFAYYALAKQYEDLEHWDKAFEFFTKAGDAITETQNYSIDDDIAILDTAALIEPLRTERVPQTAPASTTSDAAHPIFIIGLPRTGTTLVEQVLTAHSQIESLGETDHFEHAIIQLSGAEQSRMTAEILNQAELISPKALREKYLEAVSFRLTGSPFFIEKMPSNFQYLPLILRAFPEARIIWVSRNPIDACFSMFKQLFTWAYRFSYSLDNLSRYYPAYHRLKPHWLTQFQDTVTEVSYEAITAHPEETIRALFEDLSIPFEPEVLSFNKKKLTSMTASALQVREAISTKSVGRWEKYQSHLEKLRGLEALN